ncbi:MAG: hypothetical protein QOH24_1723 [Verrucomicrobiota bacterium]
MQPRSKAAPLSGLRRVPPQIVLLLATFAALIPFLNKAFHIDDPLFLWMAAQIRRHPLDPYGFNVNWIGAPEPMWSAMQNPPLCSYFMAAVSAVVGESEIALHAAFIIWSMLAVLAVFVLARRFCQSPVIAALITLFTPVFLVSATNVMCDVMLLALYLLAIEYWISGLEKRRWWLLALSALFASAAALTKYFGISVVALLAVYTLTRDWRSWPRLFWLALPVALTTAYDAWTRERYGHPLFTGATHYAQMISSRYASSFPKQLFLGCSFLGGCFFTVLFLFPPKPRIFLAGAILLAVSLACFWFFFLPGSDFGHNYFFVIVEGGIFVAIGLGVLALAGLELWQKRDAASLLLLLWITGTFGFATFLNWSVTARTMLPMAPAVAILMVRRFVDGRRFSWKMATQITLAAAVSLAIAFADYRAANSAREAAHQFEGQFRAEPGTVWFQSHWGFQFYMQQWGARALNMFNSEITSGDVMIVPANNTAVFNIPPEKVYPPEEVNFSTMPFLTTIGIRTGASFYSSVRGPLPWMLGRAPAEMYYVARFR